MLQQHEIEATPEISVGKPIPRIDAKLKSTGNCVYTRDFKLPRMLYGKIKRSPFPHARIIRIDTSAARKIPGVRALITGNDFPPLDPTRPGLHPPLARNEVLYHNQSVVAVAAVDPLTAEIAASKIIIEYEELPAVFDTELAMSDKTPSVIIHEGEQTELPNVGAHVRVRTGSFERAVEEADYIFENKYTTEPEAHFQMEPLTYVVQPDPDGGVTIWGTSSGAHKIQSEVANQLNIDPAMVRAHVLLLGGWFGSKEENHVGAVCAMLALKSNRPVKLSLTREETTTATAVLHPSIFYIKDAVTKEGKIIGRQIKCLLNGGAYGWSGNDLVRFNTSRSWLLDYKILNFNLDVYRVYTNTATGTSKRAPLNTQLAWASDGQAEIIAHRLGMDPLEFRLANVYRNGDRNSQGNILESVEQETCLREIGKAALHTVNPGPTRFVGDAWKHGKGYGLGIRSGIVGGAYQAMVRLRASGKVEVWVDLTENGQGTLTGMSQLVASEFGISPDDVIMMPFAQTSSSQTGIAFGASAERQLVHVGNAVIAACQDARRRIAQEARSFLQCAPEDIIVGGGLAICRTDPSRKIKISELFTKLNVFSGSLDYVKSGNDLAGYGTVNESTPKFDKATGKLVEGSLAPYHTSAADIAYVSVNTETGQVKVNKIIAAMDVGKAVNPLLVRGQMIGSIAMGLSALLGETLVIESGRIRNPNPTNYKMLSAVDAPVVETIIVESHFSDGPYGAKSAGEAALMPVGVSVRNAIHDAIGAWINDFPITPERVLQALDEKDHGTNCS